MVMLILSPQVTVKIHHWQGIYITVSFLQNIEKHYTKMLLFICCKLSIFYCLLSS